VLPIAIDVMSGDYEPREYLAGALRALADDPQLEALLVGEPGLIGAALAPLPAAVRARAAVVAATQVVGMEEKPREAIRRKKDSSMRVAVDQVHAGRAAACVSAGNTGALTAIAHFVLKTLPGVERAAIISAIPAAHGHTYMLDLGANVGATSQHLLQFALMGSVVAGDMLETARPRVGLLNIGQEDIKGNEVVREAGDLLARSGLNYVGFVEGDGIFNADVDVVVSDGFVGNVALKTMEGVAGLIVSFLKEEFHKTTLRELQGLVASSALDALRERLDPRRYNGASLVGLNGVVLKSHGSADKFAFETAVKTAIVEARKGVPVQIGKLIETQPQECIRA